jgi:hypothetical protein
MRKISTIAATMLCGFAGGWVATQFQPTAAASDKAIKASRFELVDTSGRIRAVLGMHDGLDVPVLWFLTRSGQEVASIGLSSSLPSIRFMGVDGRPRAVFCLTAGQRPLIALGDERWEGRIKLGAIEEDASPHGADWGLEFTGAVPSHVLAGMGLVRDSGGQFLGTLTVEDGKGKTFRAP